MLQNTGVMRKAGGHHSSKGLCAHIVKSSAIKLSRVNNLWSQYLINSASNTCYEPMDPPFEPKVYGR